MFLIVLIFSILDQVSDTRDQTGWLAKACDLSLSVSLSSGGDDC